MTSVPLRYELNELARPRGAEGSGDVGRRIINVGVAAIGLALAAPLIVLVAVLVKVTSKGPILFSQTRIGLDRRGSRDRQGRVSRRAGDLGGKPFKIYKFRTMLGGQPADAQVWASPDDPRVTPLGRTLRRYRLDELPQLWNVMLGDMNIVGPRPEQPYIFSQLREEIDGYHDRQRVRPGITGWAQVNQHYDTSVDDVKRKVAYDLEYISRRSSAEDLRIMAMTVPVMIGRKGAW